MGNPAISADGSVLVCGTAEAIFGVPGEISGFDPATGLAPVGIDLGTEGVEPRRDRSSSLQRGRRQHGLRRRERRQQFVCHAVDLVEPVFPGDADGSGTVDLADLNIVRLVRAGRARGDVDGSGRWTSWT